MKQFLFTILFFSCTTTFTFAQTIAEKKISLSSMGNDLNEEMQRLLAKVNKDTEMYHKELQALYDTVKKLHESNASPCEFRELIEQICIARNLLNELESEWRELVTQHNIEGYALWHQPNTTLEQLIIDYGAQDYVYLIPPQIGDIPISINSNLPIPRASWDEMLDTILAQNGVGVRQLNPYLRELYSIKDNRSGLSLITNHKSDLIGLSPTERIAFMLSPEPADFRRTWIFLEKFINPNSTVLQAIGRDILIISQVSDIQELLKLYDFIAANRGDKDYKAITLNRVNAEDMARILGAIFGSLMPEAPKVLEVQNKMGGKIPQHPPSLNRGGSGNIEGDGGLKIIPFSNFTQAVFLVGTKEEIVKAEKIIREVEDQVGETRKKVIFWYTTKHSDPEELAQVLERIYFLLLENRMQQIGMAFPPGGGPFFPGQGPYPPRPPGPAPNEIVQIDNPPLRRPYDEGFFLDDRFIINRRSPPITPEVNVNRDNFIVDPKTGSIAMVVEADFLSQIKELIKKLDVPKKMVEIEVLLFERRLCNNNSFGLNLLRIGSKACNKNVGSVTFNDLHSSILNAGVFEFIFSQKSRCSVPAYDLIYRFLLNQEDVRINANPSVLAINQTPAVIDITDEISISTGIFEVETISGVTLKDAFARAEYGIKINVTPTIHTQREDEEIDVEGDYVNLVTDITFQTIRRGEDPNRPDVTTRHINNEVRIPDGQTIILGGLNQKTSQDSYTSIPFLGELPGVGKLFSITEMRDDSTEMFIFLTPKIVYSPLDDLTRIRAEKLSRRPGDIPEFLCAAAEAHDWERTHLIHGSMLILLGRPPERCLSSCGGEFDGRF